MEQESVLTFQMLVGTVLWLRSVFRGKLLQRAFHESTVVRRAVDLQLTTHHWWQSVRCGEGKEDETKRTTARSPPRGWRRRLGGDAREEKEIFSESEFFKMALRIPHLRPLSLP